MRINIEYKLNGYEHITIVYADTIKEYISVINNFLTLHGLKKEQIKIKI